MVNQIDVLDKGYVRLVDHMGNDLSIVRSARVSYDADWRSGEDEGKDEKLIKYLYKNHHTSPFEAVQFTFEVKAPLFVFRQWHRHRTWSYNEVSARYTEMEDEFYVPDADKIGKQSASNKQVRDLNVDFTDSLDRDEERLMYTIGCSKSVELYKHLLGSGWPRELARMVLPLSMYSRMFASVNLNNLLKFLALRDHNHAQWEIQEYAKALRQLVTPIVPVTMKVVEELNG